MAFEGGGVETIIEGKAETTLGASQTGGSLDPRGDGGGESKNPTVGDKKIS